MHTYVGMYNCTCVLIHASMYMCDVCMVVRMHLYMYACIYVCMYENIHVCKTYLCMNVCVYTYTYTYLQLQFYLTAEVTRLDSPLSFHHSPGGDKARFLMQCESAFVERSLKDLIALLTTVLLLLYRRRRHGDSSLA